jgi:hypothetical protein
VTNGQEEQQLKNNSKAEAKAFELSSSRVKNGPSEDNT